MANKSVCSITILFPVTSDAQALDIKTKINDILSGVEETRFDFRITAVPEKRNRINADSITKPD